MKKTVLLLTLFLTAASAVAAPALKVTSGNWVEIKKDLAFAYVEFDYSKATWEGKKSYEEFCGDSYTSRTENSVITFIHTFNLGSTNLKMTNDPLDTQYKLIFHINNLERKQGMSMWGRFFIRIYGHIDIIDLESDEIVCTIAVNGHSGGDDFVPEGRLYKCFMSLGERLLRLKK